MSLKIVDFIKRPDDYYETLIIELGKLEEGILSVKLPEKHGKLGDVSGKFNTVIGNLRVKLEGLAKTSAELPLEVVNLFGIADEGAVSAEKLGGQISQIAAAMEELSITVDDIANKSAEVSKSGETAVEAAYEGGTIVSQAVDKMSRINLSVSETAQIVGKLEESSGQIGDITMVINDIADQINMLSLNAAIEAARAGEQGRGFAVVAEEVRKLAERTTTATREIDGKVKAIQSDIQGAVSRMDVATGEVTEGVVLNNQVETALKKIVGSVEAMNERIHQIAAAAEEESRTMKSISDNTISVSKISDGTVTGARELETAATALGQNIANFRKELSSILAKG